MKKAGVQKASLKRKYIYVITATIILTIAGIILSFFDNSRLLTSFRVDTYVLPSVQVLMIIYFAERIRLIARSKKKTADKKQISAGTIKVLGRFISGFISLFWVFNLVLFLRRHNITIPPSFSIQFLTLIFLPIVEIWLTFDNEYNLF
jgi:hypothetical protein